MNADPTFLGTVEDVTGATIRVQLAEGTVSGLSFIEGQSFRVGQVGGFVRIPLGFVNLYGVISQVGASAVPERLAAEAVHGNRWLTVQLVGEGQPGARFDRGLSQYPTVGDSVHLVTEADLRTIYGRPKDPRFVQVGHLASAETIPTLVDIDKLVTRHSAGLCHINFAAEKNARQGPVIRRRHSRFSKHRMMRFEVLCKRVVC